MIREITEEEIAVSVDIIRRAFGTVTDEFGLTKENAPTNGAFIKNEKLLEDYNKGIKIYGLFEGEKQIGVVALEQDYKSNSTYYLEKLAVLPQYRHKGYGAMLVDFAVEQVRSADGNTISIGLIYENKQLYEWYKRYGFTETAARKLPHLPFTVCFMEYKI